MKTVCLVLFLPDVWRMFIVALKDRLAIAIRSLKDRCVNIVSLTQVLV